MIIPVILSGGAGTRLWPISRELEPKHLVDLIGSTTLLQKTVARLNGLDDTGAPIIVGNHAHYQLVLDQLAEIQVQPAAMLLEPIGRNTAPATAVAAMTGARDGEDPILLVLPADHIIGDVERFHEAVEAGRSAAADGYLVTFGIVPDGPHTGYGYLHKGESLAGSPAFRVERFVEKPDLETAERRNPGKGQLALDMWNWCHKRGVNIRQMALQFCLAAPIDGIVLVGPNSKQQVDEVYASATADVDRDLWRDFEAAFGIGI